MSLHPLVSEVAQRIPSELKALRAKLMLESVYETLGVEEVPCPACGGSGWLDRVSLEHCPVCCGFQEVPDRLADWFKAQLLWAGQRRAPAGRPVVGCAAGASPAERPGRLAELRYRAHVPFEV